MHIPKPLGGYPLSLRPSDVKDPRRGELLFDYNTDDLYYVNHRTGQKKSIAKDIYDKLISIKLENSTLNVCKDTTETPGTETVLPDPTNRPMNSWYMAIERRVSTASEEESK